MEDNHSETGEALATTGTQAATGSSESGPNDSANGLNEIEKLQVSSDLPNDDNDDDEEEIVATIRQRKKKRGFQLLDSDSENDGETLLEKGGADNVQESGTDDKNDTAVDDACNESDSEDQTADKPGDGAEEKRLATKYKSIIDSDTESEPENAEQNEESDQEEESENDEMEAINAEKLAERSAVPKRMSAKQAMEQMKAIKSESQRLHRENYVTIPYHQPKQFSLKEFMNRKTICKPNLKEPQKRFSLKMSQDELEEFAQKLAEREKEANDFFKSEERTPESSTHDHPKIDSMDFSSENRVDVDIVLEEKMPSNRMEDKSEEQMQLDAMSTQGTQDEIISQTQEDALPRTEDNEIQSSEPLTTGSKLNNILATQSEDQFLFGTCESLVIPETEESVPLALIEDKLPANTSEPKIPAKVSTVEVVQEVLKERNALESPSLKGNPRALIDLETGNVIPPKLTGPEKLLELFLKHAKKKKPKESTSMSIVSTENGQIEVTRVDVALNEEEITTQKPGAAYFKLKDNLMKVIMKRRKEELQKRVDESKESDKENKEGYEDELYEEDDEEYCSDEDEDIIDEEAENPPPIEAGENEEIMELDQEQEEMQQDDANTDADDEYDSDESGAAGDDDNNDDDDDDDDDDLVEETKAVKTRIIKAFDDSDDENEKTDALSSQLDSGQKDPLWHDGEKRDVDEEDELLGLCSGRFDTTQKNSVISQIPTTQPQDVIDESELLALCSGTFQEGSQVPNASESQIVNSPVMALKRLESSDEENEQGSSKVVKSRHKTTRKLGFSDDEEEEETKPSENEELHDECDEEGELKYIDEEKRNEEEDLPETYIDYDSEENEIEVQLTKNGRRKKATEFLENEAELSESEWGSADEDEKDLDRYEIDLADEEEFDRAKLQSELGKIHMRHVMDDDIREVKKLQEMLIEDEETDGIGRQRKFRWQFMDEGFDFGTRVDVDGTPINMDDDDEVAWRKMQYERELLLEQNAEKLNESDLTLTPNLMGSTGKKITIVNANTKAATISESSSPFLIAKTINLSRASFLMRDTDTLSKLANITKVSGEQETGASRAGKAQNFVFASVNTPNQEKSAKRKLAIKDQSIFSQKKKRRKFRLIDQLA